MPPALPVRPRAPAPSPASCARRAPSLVRRAARPAFPAPPAPTNRIPAALPASPARLIRTSRVPAAPDASTARPVPLRSRAAPSAQPAWLDPTTPVTPAPRARPALSPMRRAAAAVRPAQSASTSRPAAPSAASPARRAASPKRLAAPPARSVRPTPTSRSRVPRSASTAQPGRRPRRAAHPARSARPAPTMPGIPCATCPAGSHAAAPGSLARAACPPGTYADTTGSATCTTCPPGTAQPVSGSTSCPACPVNTYQPASGSTDCVACPAGTHQPAPGGTSCIPNRRLPGGPTVVVSRHERPRGQVLPAGHRLRQQSERRGQLPEAVTWEPLVLGPRSATTRLQVSSLTGRGMARRCRHCLLADCASAGRGEVAPSRSAAAAGSARRLPADRAPVPRVRSGAGRRSSRPVADGGIQVPLAPASILVRGDA